MGLIAFYRLCVYANDAVADHLSPPHEQADIYETPPLSLQTFFLLITQSPPPLSSSKTAIAAATFRGPACTAATAESTFGAAAAAGTPSPQQVPEPLYMQLQERIQLLRCGTTGRKILDCKRLRKF